MRYLYKINRADLQDRERFIAFLTEQARKGLEAVRVYPFYTIFRRTTTPPSTYDMRFDGFVRNSEGNICGFKNGLHICATEKAAPCTDWEQEVTANYGSFTLRRKSFLSLKVVRYFVAPAIVLLAALPVLKQLQTLPEFSDSFPALPAVSVLVEAVLLFILLRFSITCFSCLIDQLHLKRLKAAADSGQTYRTPESLDKVIFAKNILAGGCSYIILAAELLLLAVVMIG